MLNVDWITVVIFVPINNVDKKILPCATFSTLVRTCKLYSVRLMCFLRVVAVHVLITRACASHALLPGAVIAQVHLNACLVVCAALAHFIPTFVLGNCMCLFVFFFQKVILKNFVNLQLLSCSISRCQSDELRRLRQ